MHAALQLVVYFEHGPGHWRGAIGHDLCRGVWRAGLAKSPQRGAAGAGGSTAAAGSFGQFLYGAVEGALIAQLGWSNALLALALVVLLIGVLAFGLREPGFGKGQAPAPRTQSVREALKEALGHSSFVFLTLGYFVCGFQVMFIGVHMPSYLKDFGSGPAGGQLQPGVDWAVQYLWHLYRRYPGPATA